MKKEKLIASIVEIIVGVVLLICSMFGDTYKSGVLQAQHPQLFPFLFSHFLVGGGFIQNELQIIGELFCIHGQRFDLLQSAYDANGDDGDGCSGDSDAKGDLQIFVHSVVSFVYG